MSIISWFFIVMCFPSIVTRFPSEVTVLVDTDVETLDVTMVFVEGLWTGRTQGYLMSPKSYTN